MALVSKTQSSFSRFGYDGAGNYVAAGKVGGRVVVCDSPRCWAARPDMAVEVPDDGTDVLCGACGEPIDVSEAG